MILSRKPPKVLAWLVLLSIVASSLAACGTDRFSAEGWSGMTLEETTLYVGDGDGRLLSIDADSGALQWRYPEPDDDKQRLGSIYASPAVSDTGIYVASYETRSDWCGASGNRGTTPCGRLYALLTTTQNGRTMAHVDWAFPRMDQAAVGPIIGTPKIADDLVIFGSSDGFVYAVDRTDGTPKWSFETGGGIWSSPTIQEGRALFGSLDHFVYSLDAATGEQLWKFETNGGITGEVLTSGKQLYFGSFDRHLYALHTETGEPIWATPFKGDQWFWAGPVFDGTSLFAATLNGTIYAIDPSNGQERWSGHVDGAILTPPLTLKDSVVVATDDGYLGQFRKADGWSEWNPHLGSDAKIRTPLAANGDIVYLSDADQTVRAINLTERRLKGGPGLWEFTTDD
ncbi:MAG: hypothetical protein FI680_02440 [SAR202 cluster bacterium]|nr:hypothetical protein [SAR202 cluster bacterium]